MSKNETKLRGHFQSVPHLVLGCPLSLDFDFDLLALLHVNSDNLDESSLHGPGEVVGQYN